MSGQVYWNGRLIFDASRETAEACAIDPEAWESLAEPNPTELYIPEEEGTELLPDDANVDVEFGDEYPDQRAALESIDWRGIGFLSSPESGRYTHRVRSVHGSISVDSI